MKTDDTDKKLYQPLHDQNLSTFMWCVQHDLHPSIKKDMSESKPKSTFKLLYLFIAILGLLGIGLCTQLDAIAENFRDAAETSSQVIPSNKK
jgi:hypothetical protein